MTATLPRGAASPRRPRPAARAPGIGARGLARFRDQEPFGRGPNPEPDVRCRHRSEGSRVLDSRFGLGGYDTPWGPGETRDIQVASVGGVPSAGVTAVSLAPYADTAEFYDWYYDNIVNTARRILRERINLGAALAIDRAQRLVLAEHETAHPNGKVHLYVLDAQKRGARFRSG